MILVEVTVEVGLVTYFADLAILEVAHGFIDPGIRNIRPDFPIEVIANRFAQRNIFGIAQFRIGFDFAPGIAAWLGGFVALAERIHDGFQFNRIQTDIRGFCCGLEHVAEFFAVRDRFLCRGFRQAR